MITSLGLASDGLLDGGGQPALHMAVLGHLRDGAGGGGSNDPAKYGNYARLGFGQGIALLNARALRLKQELDDSPELRMAAHSAHTVAQEIAPVSGQGEPEAAYKGAFREAFAISGANEKAGISRQEKSTRIDAVDIDDLVRWYAWIRQMEDEEDIAILLLTM